MTKPWQDPDTLQELYHERNMSQREMADELGCSQSTVQKWMKEYGIKSDLPNHLKPTPFYTNNKGYEVWHATVDGEQIKVPVHRLQAVAEFGFDSVSGMEIHHDNELKWDNRTENFELKTKEDHSRHHMNDRKPWKYDGKRGPQRA